MENKLDKKFKIHSKFEPMGDQIKAIESLSQGIIDGEKGQVLLGVTGSGKTFTIANVIEKVQKPTLVIAHNKTLAAQLTSEFKEFFPDNAVEYFVSYYDYYQPEAYVPSSDTYIAKDSSLNEEIDKLRHSATTSLLERRDVIVVASVSCIYGLGSPADYKDLQINLREGQTISRDEIVSRLVKLGFTRNDLNFVRNTFRVRGDIIEIVPPNKMENGIRIDMFDDEIEKIIDFDILTGEVLNRTKFITIFPSSHYIVSEEKLKKARESITQELEERLQYFQRENKLLEKQRLEERTNNDLEMLMEIGYCTGIENYSRHLTGQKPGVRPYTLIDFFPDDFLLVVDESHATVPQIGAMYAGDRSRKETLVDYGFRLPSALDNRPMMFPEFEETINQGIYVSATPGKYEMEHFGNKIVEQIIRPTGLLDPIIDLRPTKNQIDDLHSEIIDTIKRKERVLVTTLTKKMAEDITNYFDDLGIKVRYLHSDVKTIERMEIIRDLRLGEFDVLVGINLLREGLDIPEVSLVAILDADKEGFLRSYRSLIQTIGRAARNSEGRVILYGDKITDSMRISIEETDRRREIQKAYNTEHNIVPTTVKKDVRDILELTYKGSITGNKEKSKKIDKKEIKLIIENLEKEMKKEAKNLNFERATEIRDLLFQLKSEV